MLFSAINYPLCFWEGTGEKNRFLPGAVGAPERGREKPLLAGASVRETTLFGAVVPAALMEATSVLGEEEGTRQRPGAQDQSRKLLSPWEEVVSRLGSGIRKPGLSLDRVTWSPSLT